MLLCDVQGGRRKPQVLLSPRTPNAKVGHLPTDARHGDGNGHGTAQEGTLRMG